jgi:hypothetical protein
MKTDKIKIITNLLETLRLTHHYCDDSFYSCPKAVDGCPDESQGTGCNCGADRHNESLEKVILCVNSLEVKENQTMLDGILKSLDDEYIGGKF